jgi:transcriptional regulator with XRE-family HTH domain
MIQLERRFEVKLISANQLQFWMRYREGMSVRQLAAKCDCSHSTIGHLRSGARKTCSPELANKIARALECPKEALFMPESSIVSREIAA